MAKIKLCEITDGRVTNIALADSDNVPDFMSDWIADDGSALKGGTWDGTSFGPVPEPPPQTDAEIDAEAEEKTAKQVGDEATPETKALFSIIADLVVASGLASNKQQAVDLVAQRLKQYYADEVKAKRDEKEKLK